MTWTMSLTICISFYKCFYFFRYATDLQPDASLSASEREALMGMIVRVDCGKTGSVEHWFNLIDTIITKAFVTNTSKYAEDNGYAYPDDGPIFVNSRADKNGTLRPWAGTNGNRFPDFTLFEGKIL